MALTQDQNDALNKNIMGQFGGPTIEPPTFAPSSFDVNTQGPNMDSTVKMAGQVPGAPAPIQDMTPKPMPTPPPAPMPTVAPTPPVDTATDDEDDNETRKGNPKVASSHPGFNQDELEQYLLKQKGDIDKYGADAQAASMKNLHDQQNGWQSSIGRRMAGASDAIMQGVARAGNSGNLAAYDARQARNTATNDEQLKQLEAANLAGQKAKMGLDTQSNQNPLGASTAAAMLPMLKQIYPGKTDAEYMAMASNPAVAEGLLPEGVKLKDAAARLEDARANRQFQHQMALENQGLRRDQMYKVGLEKDTAGLDKDANFVKAQGTVDKLQTAKELLEAGNVNNASAKQALQTALTFVATGGQRVNETEMKQLGGAHTVTNRVGQWIQGLDKGTLTPKDYQDMKQVIGIYQHGAQSAMEQHIDQKAAERAQREHISVDQARQELGHARTAPAGSPAPSAQVPTITDQASYDALPVGAKYMSADGTPHTKKR